MSTATLRPLRDLRMTDATGGRGQGRQPGGAAGRGRTGAGRGGSDGRRRDSSPPMSVGRCSKVASRRWATARSRCARAASARTGPSDRLPACTNRPWTSRSRAWPRPRTARWPARSGAHLASYAAAGNGTDAGVAVIVQRMVHAAAAGVALTADPITGDRETTHRHRRARHRRPPGLGRVRSAMSGSSADGSATIQTTHRVSDR